MPRRYLSIPNTLILEHFNSGIMEGDFELQLDSLILKQVIMHS